MKPKAEWAIDSEAIRAQEIIVKYIFSNINLLNTDTHYGHYGMSCLVSLLNQFHCIYF